MMRKAVTFYMPHSLWERLQTLNEWFGDSDTLNERFERAYERSVGWGEEIMAEQKRNLED